MSHFRPFLILMMIVIIMASACQPASQPTNIPTSAPISEATATQAPRRFIRGTKPAVYRLMEDGTIRHIVDWHTFLGYGFDAGAIQVIPDAELAGYPLGLPLTRWVTGETDQTLYYLQTGKRYPLSLAQLEIAGRTRAEVTRLSDALLNALSAASDTLPVLAPFDAAHPLPVVAAWQNGKLQVTTVRPDDTPLYIDAAGNTWFAGNNQYDGEYRLGRGLVRRGNGLETAYALDSTEHDPFKQITTIAVQGNILWAGTRAAGLIRYNLTDRTHKQYTSLNSNLADDRINDLKLTPSGAGDVWLALPSGVARFRFAQGESWELFGIPGGVTDEGVRTLAIGKDGTVWASGEHFIARIRPDEPDKAKVVQAYTALDQTLLLDDFRLITLDDTERPWFVGRHSYIHLDTSGQIWQARNVDTGADVMLEFDPLPPAPLLPNPRDNYTAWVKAWPRPAADNGLCMHFVQYPSGTEFDTRWQIERLKKLNIHWVLVNYTARYQMVRMAPIFAQAGITVIWRPFVRPYQEYDGWADEVKFLRLQGFPPYLQVYNEPSLGQEWDGKPIDQELYFSHLIPAMQQVYEAGGFIGLQEIEPDWLRATLRRIKDRNLDTMSDRIFFVPHPYGFNHPPVYDSDYHSVLGFGEFARIFEEEIGFVPVMIAGEGGWRPGEAQDAGFPAVSEDLHRDYHLAVFDWFRSGKLSNGTPLPDYLFAFCPWLLSDPNDPAAWFDSRAGNRLVIGAVEKLPPFVRRFSWDGTQ